MVDYPLAEDVRESCVERLEADGDDSVYVHFSNGVLLNFAAIVVDGKPELHVTRVAYFQTRFIH